MSILTNDETVAPTPHRHHYATNETPTRNRQDTTGAEVVA